MRMLSLNVKTWRLRENRNKNLEFSKARKESQDYRSSNPSYIRIIAEACLLLCTKSLMRCNTFILFSYM